MTNVVNKESYIWFARIVEELVTVQVLFNYFQQYFEEIKKLGKIF